MGIVDGNLRRQKIDQSPNLFHFTKGTIEEAGNAMYSIIESERLISTRGYISFTSSPITALKKFFETKNIELVCRCISLLASGFHEICW